MKAVLFCRDNRNLDVSYCFCILNTSLCLFHLSSVRKQNLIWWGQGGIREEEKTINKRVCCFLRDILPNGILPRNPFFLAKPCDQDKLSNQTETPEGLERPQNWSVPSRSRLKPDLALRPDWSVLLLNKCSHGNHMWSLSEEIQDQLWHRTSQS